MSNVLEIKTVQTIPFRTLITSLKDILIETNITFTMDGLKIYNTDKSQTILIDLQLDADKFEEYTCTKQKIIIGVNMSQLFKLISTMNNDDTLTIYIEDNDYNDGIVHHLGLKFENGNRNHIHKLKLIDPDEELDSSEPIHIYSYSSIINMPSANFQKIIKDYKVFSDIIEIKSYDNVFIFQCKGQYNESTCSITESNDNLTLIQQEKLKIIQGEFSLKSLIQFTKCTNLCSHIELYIENDKPLVVKYNVASLGEIKLCCNSLSN